MNSLSLVIAPAMAQTMLYNPPGTAAPIDLNTIIIASIGGLVSIVGTIGVALINSKIKDRNSAATLDAALTNALGMVQNAIDSKLQSHPIQVTVPGISPALASGVQYVIDNAGKEANRFNITPDAIAQKIEARMGVIKMEAKIAK